MDTKLEKWLNDYKLERGMYYTANVWNEFDVRAAFEAGRRSNEEEIAELQKALRQVGGESCNLHLCGIIAEKVLDGKA